MEKRVNWGLRNILKINRTEMSFDRNEVIITGELRKQIEPWLSAVFQSEHMSTLFGAGLTIAVTSLANCSSQGMNRITFNGEYSKHITEYADKSAEAMERGYANFEDDLRTANELLKGLKIIDEEKALNLEIEISAQLSGFLKNIIETEHEFLKSISKTPLALNYLKSFLVSFSSRTSTRDRLHIFTTNYDRFIEFGCDSAGIMMIDRFIGKVRPIFRSGRFELDYFYNPPGIRGEPRFVEGVVRFTKLHGSVDWISENKIIRKLPVDFGDTNYPEIDPYNHLVIYPNSSKDIETDYYPYADLFRDFSSAICKPNSVIVTYGYSFGDLHINRIIEDMLSIPSTHIVIISYDDSSQRIQKFYEKHNPAQFTLLIGNHFGDLKTLVDHYLPKAAIDRISIRSNELQEKRGDRVHIPELDNGQGVDKVEGERDSNDQLRL
jgi:SIR2-like domain